MRPKVLEALPPFFRGEDFVISKTNKRKTTAIIWQLCDDEETAKVADGLLALAQRWPTLAVVLRGGTVVNDSYAAGEIILKNTIATIVFYLRNGGIG